jgi:1-acyl-sn-glycerol-3-phosphate acyltransferase
MNGDPSYASGYWRVVEGPPRRGARLLQPLASAIVRAAWQVRVHDRHLVPRTGPVILAANHTGLLDGPLVYAVVPRPVHALVKVEMFRGVVGRALRSLGQIAVDRFNVDPAAVKSSLAVLERGEVLAIYPEGTRGDGDFEQIKPGVAYLGLCSGAPIVPVACLGIRETGRSTGSLPGVRSRLDVVFGAPLRLEPVGWPRRQQVVRDHTKRLRDSFVEHIRHACELTGRALPKDIQ